jgi:predicted nucleic acid-binding protein
MGPFIADTSITLAWCFADESTESSRNVLAGLQSSYAVVPSLWPFEVANALTSAERRGRISPSEITGFLQFLNQMPIHVERRESLWLWQAILPITRQFRLSAYDAAYLDLAKRESLPLGTLDANLRAAALALQIPVIS